MEAANKILIVLGKNLGYLGNPDEIKNSSNFLSKKSEITTHAAGILFNQRKFNKLILSGGFTSGKNLPSEAEAMKRFLLKNYPQIPESAIILEEVSVDTKQNALEVKKILDKNNLKADALLTISPHSRRANSIFKKNKMDLKPINSDIVLKSNSPELYKNYKNEIKSGEKLAELWLLFIQSIPLIGPWVDKWNEAKRARN